MTGTQVIIYVCIGLLAGFMNGMFGIGGGSVGIPLLNLTGIPLLSAFAINLFVIPFTSLVSAITHRKNIDKKTAVYVIIGGSIGEVTGAISVGLISTLILAIIFVITASTAVSAMYLDRIAPRIYRKVNPTPRNFLLFSFILNLITGLRGGSGGSLFPPFLRVMKLDPHKAIATSVSVTIFTAIAGIMVYWKRGDIIWLPALFVLAGSMIGARTGSRFSLKTRGAYLEAGLAILVIGLAFITVYKAL